MINSETKIKDIKFFKNKFKVIKRLKINKKLNLIQKSIDSNLYCVFIFFIR